jgi:hypothetical protein
LIAIAKSGPLKAKQQIGKHRPREAPLRNEKGGQWAALHD